MFSYLWRRLWSTRAVPPRVKGPRVGRVSCRLRLEPLEDRLMPTLTGGVLAIALAPSAASPLAASSTSGQATPISVTVAENSRPIVIDLEAAFATVSGLQHQDGLKLSILSNSNPGLVKTSLSEEELTLTFAQGKCGKATITVCATDADGVSVKRAIVVTVLPLSSTAVVSASLLRPNRLVARSGTAP